MPTALERLQALLQEMKRQTDKTNPYDPDVQCGAWSFQEGTNEAAKLWHERLQEVERAFRQEASEQSAKVWCNG